MGEEKLSRSLLNFPEAATSEERKKLFPRVLAVIRQAGIEPLVRRIGIDLLKGLQAKLPLVVELKDGRYCVLEGFEGPGPDAPSQLRLLTPRDIPKIEIVPLEQFQKTWTGGILVFEKVNTALICS